MDVELKDSKCIDWKFFNQRSNWFDRAACLPYAPGEDEEPISHLLSTTVVAVQCYFSIKGCTKTHAKLMRVVIVHITRDAHG